MTRPWPWAWDARPRGWYRDEEGDHFGPMPANAKRADERQAIGREVHRKRSPPWAPIDPWKERA